MDFGGGRWRKTEEEGVRHCVTKNKNPTLRMWGNPEAINPRRAVLHGPFHISIKLDRLSKYVLVVLCSIALTKNILILRNEMVGVEW